MKPPEKETGAVLGAPKTAELGNTYHACAHAATLIPQEKTESPHYGREVCADCGRFIRWLAKPETIERRKLNACRLARLAICPWLTLWERNFVTEVSERRKLSPRQEAIVDRLWAEHAMGRAS